MNISGGIAESLCQTKVDEEDVGGMVINSDRKVCWLDVTMDVVSRM
jgi:hypothetical protein